VPSALSDDISSSASSTSSSPRLQPRSRRPRACSPGQAVGFALALIQRRQPRGGHHSRFKTPPPSLLPAWKATGSLRPRRRRRHDSRGSLLTRRSSIGVSIGPIARGSTNPSPFRRQIKDAGGPHHRPVVTSNHRPCSHEPATLRIYPALLTTGFARFAVRHGRTAEARTRTTQPLPCGFCPGARQRAHDAFLPGKDLCRAP
jgi:hypothetical protein